MYAVNSGFIMKYRDNKEKSDDELIDILQEWMKPI
jgi:hypothetical protein